MTALLHSLACAAGAAVAVVCLFAPEWPVYQVRAVTMDGQEYIAGSGDDCRAAWENAVIPDNWVKIDCIKSN